MDSDLKDGCAWIIALLIILALSLFLGPLFFMLTWNCALCAVFVMVPTVTYWQAFGICILLDIIGGKFYYHNFKKD